MEAKFTVTVKKHIIERGKRYARKRKTSLSKLIENYLERITSKEHYDEITPLVKSLSGIVKLKGVSNHKKEHVKYLAKKYG